MVPPPAIVVHGLDHAQLALAAGLPVTLLSAPGAALYAGALWWRALVQRSGTGGPDLLDCADAPGRALEALACGCRGLVLHPCKAWPTVAAHADAAGATLLAHRPRRWTWQRPGRRARLPPGSPSRKRPPCRTLAASTSSPPPR